MSKIFHSAVGKTLLILMYATLLFILVVSPILLLLYENTVLAVIISLVVIVPLNALTFSTIYHKVLSHRSFTTDKWIIYCCVIIGMVVLRLPPPVYFASMHRLHHKYSDTNADPHSPIFGKRYVYFPWFFKRINQENISEEIYKVGADIRKEYPFLTKLSPMFLLILTPIYLSLLYIISYDAFILGSSIILFNTHLHSFGNTFLHKKTGKEEGTSVNLGFGARWISPEFNHDQHHKYPRSYDFGTETIKDWTVPFIEKFLIRNR